MLFEQKTLLKKLEKQEDVMRAPGFQIGCYPYEKRNHFKPPPVIPRCPSSDKPPEIRSISNSTEREQKEMLSNSMLMLKIYMSKPSYMLVNERPKISEETLIGLAGM